MIMTFLFGIVYLIIIFVNRRDYFKTDILFYLIIFDINLAAILFRWNNHLMENFFEEQYYQK